MCSTAPNRLSCALLIGLRSARAATGSCVPDRDKLFLWSLNGRRAVRHDHEDQPTDRDAADDKMTGTGERILRRSSHEGAMAAMWPRANAQLRRGQRPQSLHCRSTSCRPLDLPANSGFKNFDCPQVKFCLFRGSIHLALTRVKGIRAKPLLPGFVPMQRACLAAKSSYSAAQALAA